MALVELLKNYPSPGTLVTRRYPVNLPGLKEKLSQDLMRPYEAIIHLGQSPGASSIKLEAIAINAAGCVEDRGDELTEIIPNGPVGFRSNMPLARWASILRNDNIPSSISYHAGTYLCNAAMYLSHHYLHANGQNDRPCQVAFVHLPLATEQVAHQSQSLPSLPVTVLARAIRLLVEDVLQSDKLVSKSEQIA
jgi:pyroglutamyl-peptidase